MVEDFQNIDLKPFKILSIDGGGIKGLYSSTILEHLEQRSRPISEYFDMLCGTSTGGLIALCLGLGLSAKEISGIYEQHGRKIFPRRTWLGGIFRQTAWGGKYNDAPLKEVLDGIFGDAKIGDLDNLVCIPSYSFTDARPWVFKRDHGKLDRDNNASLVDVALATSAAPTYFPLCEIPYYNNKQFIDGGVWANNPSLVGVIEALTYFVGKDKQFSSVELLSVSSLNNTSGKPVGLKRHRSFLQCRNDLFDTSLIGQSQFTDYFLTRLCEMNDIKINYKRIPSELISAEQQHLVKLDCASEKAIQFIKGKGNDRGTLAKKDLEVERFFQHKKKYKIDR